MKVTFRELKKMENGDIMVLDLRIQYVDIQVICDGWLTMTAMWEQFGHLIREAFKEINKQYRQIS